MGVDYTADSRECAVQFQVSRRVAGGLPLALGYLPGRKLDYHHVLGGHSLIRNAGGLDHYHSALAVDGGNIAPCERYKIVFRKQKISFKYFLL